MNWPILIFVLGLILVVVFFKDFHAFVYFIVAVDIFLRLVTYLKVNIIRDTAFEFLNAIPADIPSLINSLDLGAFSEFLMFVYIIAYIIFEGFLIRNFIRRKF